MTCFWAWPRSSCMLSALLVPPLALSRSADAANTPMESQPAMYHIDLETFARLLGASPEHHIEQLEMQQYVAGHEPDALLHHDAAYIAYDCDAQTRRQLRFRVSPPPRTPRPPAAPPEPPLNPSPPSPPPFPPSPPSFPPPYPPDYWLNCQRSFEREYDQATVWWSGADNQILVSALLNLGMGSCCFFLWLILSAVGWTRRRIYAPRVNGEVWAPRVWRESVKYLLYPPEWTPQSRRTLEFTMAIRYLAFNFKLFGLFTPIALVLMLPVNAIVAESDLLALNLNDAGLHRLGTPSPPPLAPGTESYRTSWSGFESLTIQHVPPGSMRMYAPVICMYILSLLFLSLLTREWPRFVKMRHLWLQQRRPSDLACVFTVNGKRATSVCTSQLHAQLATLAGRLFVTSRGWTARTVHAMALSCERWRGPSPTVSKTFSMM
eukprot:6204003-Pleurochrysis_carterae.AAC.2